MTAGGVAGGQDGGGVWVQAHDRPSHGQDPQGVSGIVALGCLRSAAY